MNQEEARNIAEQIIRRASYYVGGEHNHFLDPDGHHNLTVNYSLYDNTLEDHIMEISFNSDPRNILSTNISCPHPMLADAVRNLLPDLVGLVLRRLPIIAEHIHGLGDAEDYTPMVLVMWQTRIPILVEWKYSYTCHVNNTILEYVLSKLTVDLNRFVSNVQGINSMISLSGHVVDDIIIHAVNKALGGSKVFQEIMSKIINLVMSNVSLHVAGDTIDVIIPRHEELCVLLLSRQYNRILEIPSIRNIKI